MPRVLHCISSLETGGVEKRVVRQLEWMAGHDGWEHVLLAFRGGELAERARTLEHTYGIPAVILAKKKSWDGGFNRDFSREAARVMPDLVIAYNFVASFWSRLILRGRFDGVVVHEGGVRNAGVWWGRASERLLGRWTRDRIFNSRSTAAVWHHSLRRPSTGHVVLNGVPLPNAPRTDPPRSPFTIICVGRLVPVKGTTIILEALALLREDVPDARLIVVGNGPESANLKRLSNELGVSEAVEWTGYVSDPWEWLRKAHVYVGASYNETFSLTLCEAMSLGLACVASRVGGPVEIIQHEKDGILVPCRLPIEHSLARNLPDLVADPESDRIRRPLAVDPNELALALGRLASDYELRQRLGEQAAINVRKRFSMDTYGRNLLDTYRTILGDGA